MTAKTKAEAPTELVLEDISEAEIPQIHQRGSHRFGTVLAAAPTWAKGRGARFTVNSRSSVTSLKKQLADLGCDLVTRTLADKSIQVYAYRPKTAPK